MYSLLLEGYTASYSPLGGEDREIHLKSGIWVKAVDVKGMLEDIDGLTAVEFYLRWKRLGMPYGPWGVNPNRLVEIIDILEPVDSIYHPKLI